MSCSEIQRIYQELSVEADNTKKDLIKLSHNQKII